MQESFAFVEPPDRGPRVLPVRFGTSRVTVATCGFSYKEWIGPFYPPRTKPAEMLEFYAERFSAVEIDSSYYGVPSEKTIASMERRTPADFRFTLKLPGTVTHLPVEEGMRVHDDARLFRENVEPLVAAGKLAVVLMQFPNAFRPSERTHAYLAELRAVFPDLPLVAEFRHNEWQRPETFVWLAQERIGWCNVDEPHFETLVRPSSDVVGDIAYVRFHGRNAKTWWKGDATERYDYEYGEDELAPWVARVGDMAAVAPETFVMFNNHRFGKAAKNAAGFARMLLAVSGDGAA